MLQGYRPIGDGSFDGGAAGDDGPGTTARPRSTTVVVRCLSPRPGRAPQTPDAAGDVVRNSSLVACGTVGFATIRSLVPL